MFAAAVEHDCCYLKAVTPMHRSPRHFAKHEIRVLTLFVVPDTCDGQASGRFISRGDQSPPSTSIHDHVEHASDSSPSGHSEKHPQAGTV